ncbi:SPOR domain-containing protein [Nannocystis bainbridge]|uniref:SPOR domain-containing protein n=1 Tax=Nannocystis bainbridge TaxID=2995303 RepID=A0ABT5E1J2_9BACT|nr:SPOR domain-containing protein [Nannocystis bainbridge]MDC0719744.1 SPOR domain-containing protein [Nannocystis bainbridge]
MPELTAPKEKVDFSLDNRQVFFLFFGLSVVGCFVFALGVMVGRRNDAGNANAQAVAHNETRAVLADPEPLVADAGYSFKDGLQHPATEGVPETRDPAVPPRDESVVRAEREAAMGGVPGKNKKPSKKPIPAPGKEPAMASAPKVLPPLASVEPPAAPLPAAIVEKDSAKDSIVAAVKGDVVKGDAPSAKGKKGFALQMKAFASQDDATKLADKLRRNGHEVRVESGESAGRMWHRVRIGEFTSWDAAVSAKAAFEKQESVIAYVVSL